MRTTLIVSLVFAVIVVVFALQNPDETSLVLGPYTITTSLALIIIVTLVIGFLLGLLATVPKQWMRSRKVKKLEKELVKQELTKEQATDQAH